MRLTLSEIFVAVVALSICATFDCLPVGIDNGNHVSGLIAATIQRAVTPRNNPEALIKGIADPETNDAVLRPESVLASVQDSDIQIRSKQDSGSDRFQQWRRWRNGGGATSPILDEFHSYQFLTFATENVSKSRVSGQWHRGGEKNLWSRSRPNWPTFRRCTKTGCRPCDEDDDGCFHHHQKGLESKMRADSDTVFSETVVELKCDHKGQRVKAGLKYDQPTNGAVRWLWNGEELSRLGAASHRLDNLVLTGKSGLNVLRIQFKRLKQDLPARVLVKDFFMRNTPGFTECEDNKVCLAEMADGKKWPQGAQDLKVSTRLQYTCLFDGEDLLHAPNGDLEKELRASCGRWTTCLTKSGRLDDIKATLQAFGAQNAPQLPHYENRGEQRSMIQVDPKCFDPFTEDPEAWSCAGCKQAADALCTKRGTPPGSTGFGKCYQSALCMSSKVCKHWKDAICAKDSQFQEDVRRIIDENAQLLDADTSTLPDSNGVAERHDADPLVDLGTSRKRRSFNGDSEEASTPCPWLQFLASVDWS